MSKANNSPDPAIDSETERLPWKRPTLQRLSASQAEMGLAGGGDTPGKDAMS